ncbi:KilA-N domain-containing protein [Endozoicomonas sp. Mp262]|uniref:KilA-N domain-containing protein n=1 Tax=Endozoicomonas sp. Mp262 TaxID=2919499 RepID=UPI0021D9BACD
MRKVRGGNNAGTWADKLLAYDYAGWIDPEFKVGVYTILDKFFADSPAKISKAI